MAARTMSMLSVLKDILAVNDCGWPLQGAERRTIRNKLFVGIREGGFILPLAHYLETA